MIYIIQMSKGDNIKIDEEDLKKIQENIGASLIRVKQAIINPSFMVAIIPTNEEEFKVKTLLERRGDVMAVVGEEKVPLLTDKMSIQKKLSTV